MVNDAVSSRYSIFLQMMSLVFLFHKKSDIIVAFWMEFFSQNHLTDIYNTVHLEVVAFYFPFCIVLTFIATNSYLNVLLCNKGNLLKPLEWLYLDENPNCLQWPSNPKWFRLFLLMSSCTLYTLFCGVPIILSFFSIPGYTNFIHRWVPLHKQDIHSFRNIIFSIFTWMVPSQH